MKKKLRLMGHKALVLLMAVTLGSTTAAAQEVKKSEMHQQAENEDAKGNIAPARFRFIRAYEGYAAKGQLKEALTCGIRATELYYERDSYYKEAFDLLRRIDQTITDGTSDSKLAAALHYEVSKERLQMNVKLRRADYAKEQLAIMDEQAKASADEALANDFLYNKAIYYYTFGQTAQGNAVFKEMSAKLTAQKEYSKVDEVYQTLIANGRRSNSASLVAQSYKSYIEWKDSVSALKHADETRALKQQIADNEAAIADRDSSLTARMATIVGLAILAAALAAALVVGGIVLMRYLLLTRRQKKQIQLANENNALKAQFISNISAQLAPALQQLDQHHPQVKALSEFASHIEQLSSLEATIDEPVEMEEVQIQPFCEAMADTIRDKVKSEVAIHVNAPRMVASFNKEYVAHILQHLLRNAAEYTPEGGTITLDYKKRGAHSHQFLVADTGERIDEEQRAELFKAFREVRDLTKGDGLGLPICRQMALKMKGDLDIDPAYTKGTRFVLDLHS